MKDYKLINGYKKFFNEIDIGLEYKKKGFYNVIINNPAINDLGKGRGAMTQLEKCLTEEKLMPQRV